jgi:hypothetical protein
MMKRGEHVHESIHHEYCYRAFSFGASSRDMCNTLVFIGFPDEDNAGMNVGIDDVN